jgi:hypothetical protein
MERQESHRPKFVYSRWHSARAHGRSGRTEMTLSASAGDRRLDYRNSCPAVRLTPSSGRVPREALYGEEKARHNYRNAHGSTSSRTWPLDSMAARDEHCHCGRRNGSCLVLVFPDIVSRSLRSAQDFNHAEGRVRIVDKAQTHSKP